MSTNQDHKRTGVYRLVIRKRLFRSPILVFQVEVSEPAQTRLFSDGYRIDHYTIPEACYWRDGTVADVHALKLKVEVSA